MPLIYLLGAFESEVPAVTVCGRHSEKGTAWHSESVLINIWANVWMLNLACKRRIKEERELEQEVEAQSNEPFMDVIQAGLKW